MKTNKLLIKFLPHPYEGKDKKIRLLIRLNEGRENRYAYNTGIRIYKKFWDGLTDKVTDKHPEHKIVNLGIVEWRKKILEIQSKYDANDNYRFENALNELTGRMDATTLENYVESHYKENFDEIAYTNNKDRLRYFKQVLGIKQDLNFNDIDNNLIKKYRKKVDKRIKEREGSTTTYKAYLQAVLSICKEAFENKHISESIEIADRLKRFKNVDFGENPSCSSDEVIDAINQANTIQRWESVAQWLLMFGMRGLYPSDIAKIGENYLYRDTDNGKRMPYEKVTKNLRKDWENNNLWLDYKRAKTAMPMFIKLLPSVSQLIEKLKYSYMYTHADFKIGGKHIVTDINNRLSIVSYSVEDNYKEHKQLWRNRQVLLGRFSKLGTFKTPRKTYYQIADDEKDELTAKKLVGQTTDALSKNFYSKYNTKKQVEKLDKVHKKVLREFKFDELVAKLITKFHELVLEDKAPKWLLKQSAVMQEGKEWKVLVGFKDRKPQYEMIPFKYKRFLDDQSIKEGYWVDLEENDNTERLERVFSHMRKIKVVEESKLDNNAKKETLELQLDKLIKAEKYEECALVKKQIQELEAV